MVCSSCAGQLGGQYMLQGIPTRAMRAPVHLDKSWVRYFRMVNLGLLAPGPGALQGPTGFCAFRAALVSDCRREPVSWPHFLAASNRQAEWSWLLELRAVPLPTRLCDRIRQQPLAEWPTGRRPEGSCFSWKISAGASDSQACKTGRTH